MALTVGSLFSGIGGIDLGLERAGMVTRWFVEIDPHCRNVLARHWPGIPIYGDITAIDWSGVEPVDVLAGGFPCQPVSAAGQQRGQEDERWLWPEFARAIRMVRPRYVLLENVRNLLAISNGAAASEVYGDLAALGYDADGDCIPASAVGAPHERDRLWIVAHANRQQHEGGSHEERGTTASDLLADTQGLQPQSGSERAGTHTPGHRGTRPVSGRPEACQVLAHAYFAGLERREQLGQYAREQSAWADGEALPDGRIAPPGLPRVAHGVPHRVDRLRALGNAVVPQVVEWIGRRIAAFDEGRRVVS